MKILSVLINSIFAAFSTYSRIPVPPARWDEESLRWQICSFPLVGAVIGLIWCAAGTALRACGAHPALSGAVLCALPLLLTGGIHMDGYLDTTDAVHSWKPKEERLRILDDPHIGAFAFISGAVYLLLYFGLCCQIADSAGGQAALFMMLSAFIRSRILSGLAAVFFPKSKKQGMLRSVSDASDRRAGAVLAGWLVILEAGTCAAAFFMRIPGILTLPAAACAAFFYYRHMADARFGGISGDLAGWFLQVSEIAQLAAAAVYCLLR